MNHFIQTTPLDTTTLKRAVMSAISQEEAIMEFFNSQPNTGYTPSQVHHYLTRNRIINAKTPLTSVRRAMSLLTDENRLEKTNETCLGDFGKPEYKWKFTSNNKYEQTKLF